MRARVAGLSARSHRKNAAPRPQAHRRDQRQVARPTATRPAPARRDRRAPARRETRPKIRPPPSGARRAASAASSWPRCSDAPTKRRQIAPGEPAGEFAAAGDRKERRPGSPPALRPRAPDGSPGRNSGARTTISSGQQVADQVGSSGGAAAARRGGSESRTGCTRRAPASAAASRHARRQRPGRHRCRRRARAR